VEHAYAAIRFQHQPKVKLDGSPSCRRVLKLSLNTELLDNLGIAVMVISIDTAKHRTVATHRNPCKRDHFWLHVGHHENFWRHILRQEIANP
jgi:hypothetical protein